ncbi:hypothetical protein [Helicobacter mesocricetorum]|uniref:hypothetical protein n=1 Tax=Helicobacter mesocricetorum TaxID=87012 RepID=UPI000CF01B74|nr:hypothetical protein [Helicobacter mesocricetorum]
MNANKAKLLLQEYFRYKRGYIGVVSEYSFWLGEIEDIVAFNNKEIVVVEIKLAKNDFLRDFKKAKHSKFKKPYNKFYFFVPNELLGFVLEYLEVNGYKDYGVLSINSNKEIYVAKRANALKGSCLLNVFSDYTTLQSLISRMSSEIIIERKKSILPHTNIN